MKPYPKLFASTLFLIVCSVTSGQAQALFGQRPNELLLRLDASTIREVAAEHPRFAAALASFNLTGGVKSKSNRLFLTPAAISREEVERWLLPEREAAAYFKEKATSKPSAVGNPRPVIYEVTVEESAGSDEATLRLRQVGTGGEADPPYTSLEMRLRAAGRTDTGARVWAVRSWAIR